MSKAPNVVPKNLRGSSIPAGYVLGRVSTGTGAIELISASQLKANGITPSSLPGPPTGPAGGDLSGTYPNPTVAKLRGILLNSTAPTSGQVLTYDGSEATWEDPSSGILIGTGAPTALEPAGTLYSQDDADAVWSSQPTTISGAPAVVQFASTSGSAAIGAPTLGSNPTVGNLLIAIIGTGHDHSANLSADWTSFENGSGGGTLRYGRALYRYVQPGDVAALPAIGSGGTYFWFAEVYEVSGVTGVFATDVVAHPAIYGQSSSPFNTPAASTSGNNQLVLLGTGDYDASSNFTNPSGWTNDILTNNNGNYGAWMGSHKAFASSGTSIQASIAFPTGSLLVAFAIQVVFADNSGGMVANWDLVGPEVVPNGANPTATAGPAAVNGSASTFMRSDAAPAVQKASASQFGIVEVDNTTITAAAGVISAVAALPAVLGFFAQLNANQSVTDNTVTKVVNDTLLFNTVGTQYSTSTGKFTPTKAGKYLLFAGSRGACSTTMTQFQTWLAKNGTHGSGGTDLGTFLTGVFPGIASLSNSTLLVVLVDMNGSTDFVELDTLITSTGATGDVVVGNPGTFLGGIYLGS